MVVAADQGGRLWRRAAGRSTVKVLVSGRDGQLARSLRERGAGEQKFELFFAGRPEVDLNIPGQLARAIAEQRPDAVVNAAAYTNVDGAEDEPEIAFRVNAD